MSTYRVAADLEFWRHSDSSIGLAFAPSVGRGLQLASEFGELLKSHAASAIEFDTADLKTNEVDLLLDAGIVFLANEAPPAFPPLDPLLKEIEGGDTISSLELIVAEGCNFGCEHCIHSNDVEAHTTRKLNTYMNVTTALEVTRKFIDFLRQKSRKNGHINFGAAEPLLRWEVIEAVTNFIRSEVSDINIQLSLVSNLSLLNKARADFLHQHNVQISSSLDGTREANNLIRITKKGAGTFDLIVERLQMLKAKDQGLDAITLTITNKNIGAIDVCAYLDLVESLEMRGVGVDFDLVGSESVSPLTIVKLLLDFYTECEKRALYCTGTWLKPLENILLDRSLPGVPSVVGFCKAVEGFNVAVAPDKKLFMCGYTSSQLGTFDEFPDGYTSQLTDLLLARDRAVQTHCAGCFLRAACRGQCHVTHEVDGVEKNNVIISGKIDMMCEVYRTITVELGKHLTYQISQ